jgi:hypothetical protein
VQSTCPSTQMCHTQGRGGCAQLCAQRCKEMQHWDTIYQFPIYTMSICNTSNIQSIHLTIVFKFSKLVAIIFCFHFGEISAHCTAGIGYFKRHGRWFVVFDSESVRDHCWEVLVSASVYSEKVRTWRPLYVTFNYDLRELEILRSDHAMM